ncbi:MAG: hypothetical protein B6D47_11360 [Rhodocyclaceae bacterium UTPRO2]|nr:MAG: hypothetical protein B6D47_11360 [Rhodocyclaceae bacterium UTPRO2]
MPPQCRAAQATEGVPPKPCARYGGIASGGSSCSVNVWRKAASSAASVDAPRARSKNRASTSSATDW